GTVGPNVIVGINLGAGVNATGYLFGEIAQASSSLAGVVFVDLNGDGIRQAAEPGISGVVISLTGTDINGAVNRSTTTGADGSWSFADLLPGTYTVIQSQPTGWGQGTTSAGTAGGTVVGDVISGIVLGADVEATGYLFAEVGITIRGRVFNDLNANGNLDLGELGRSGVVVTLVNQATGQTLTAITNAAGEYSFANLGPASYTIQAVNPDATNLALTTDPSLEVTITNAGVVGGFINDRNFGLAQVSSLAGVVFNDLNNNGVLDPGEAGIASVTMMLTGVQNNGQSVNRTLQTGADGTFNFTGLLAGTYTLTQTQPANFDDGIITAGTAGGTVGPNVIVGIGLGSGVNATGYLFAEIGQVTSSLSGSVYVDLNRDGIRQSSEPGLAGVVITLTGTDANGAVNRSTTTDASGNWTFADLLPGVYTVTQTQPTGWAQGTNQAGTAGGTIVGDVISGINLGADITATGYTFGELGVAVRGTVFNDTNANGNFDGGELGRAGVVVTLRNVATNQTFSAITNANGEFEFADLGPATYVVQIVNPDTVNLAISTQSSLQVTITNAGLTTGFIGDQDFGLAQVSSIAGVVFNDLNGNNIRNLGEPGIPNVTITLTGVQNNGQSVNLTLLTGADGSYKFQGLLAGTFTITQTQPPGFDDGVAIVGTAGGIANTNVITSIVLGVGVNATGYDFAERKIPVGSISGFVYIDINANGTRQVGEPGLPGVVITLTGTDSLGNAVEQSVVTAVDGSFIFANLRNGVYTLTQTQPPGFPQGTTRAGTAGGIVNGDVISNINLGPNVNAINYLFGELGVGFTGQVFNDLNADGLFDVGETGRPGTTVTLRNVATGFVRVTVSNGAGNFSFGNLAPGTYTLSAVLPSGFVISTPAQELTVVIPNVGLPDGPLDPKDIGVTRVSSLAGLVYFDANTDGIRQLTESGLAGIQIQLTGVQNNGVEVVRNLNSSPNGSFNFTNLLAGTYSITVFPPNGFVSGFHTVGTAGGTVGLDSIDNIVLPSQFVATNYAMAMIGDPSTSIVSGRVYYDANQNGRLDWFERGFGGVLVVLRGTDNAGNQVVRSVLSDPTGNYFFIGLEPGTYQVQRVPQFGLVNARGQVGSLGGTARAYALITDIVLSENQTGTGYNFGEYGAGISRRFFLTSVA
ncbi:MAG TPA: SdrD B-like domain-containing protein, partial [Gemmatales bacterium]|nr:SdrD B-like domain-containing protein [Gemmatales bacterium]